MGNTGSKSSPVQTIKKNIPTVSISYVEEKKDSEIMDTIKVKPKSFSIQGKNLKLDGKDNVKALIEEMEKCELNIIDLSGNTIGVEAAHDISNAIMNHHSTLENINLSDCFTGRLKEEVPKALEEFSNSLSQASNLNILNLSDNAFGPAGAKAISGLLSKAQNLETFLLNNNGLGPTGGNIIAEALLSLQESNTEKKSKSNLRRIMIGRNRLENGSAPSIGAALQLHGLLEKISLPQNGIRPEGIASLCRALSHCHHLRILDLQDNTFSKEGALALADSLNSWPNLKILNIGDCLLGREGSKVVLEALFKNENSLLESINLQFNEIDEFGAALIAANLKNLTYLKELSLNGNEFNPQGIAASSIKEVSHGQIILDEWNEMEFSEMSEISSEESEEEEEKKEEKSSLETEKMIIESRSEQEKKETYKEMESERIMEKEEDLQVEKLVDMVSKIDIVETEELEPENIMIDDIVPKVLIITEESDKEMEGEKEEIIKESSLERKEASPPLNVEEIELLLEKEHETNSSSSAIESTTEISDNEESKESEIIESGADQEQSNPFSKSSDLDGEFKTVERGNKFNRKSKTRSKRNKSSRSKRFQQLDLALGFQNPPPPPSIPMENDKEEEEERKQAHNCIDDENDKIKNSDLESINGKTESATSNPTEDEDYQNDEILNVIEEYKNNDKK